MTTIGAKIIRLMAERNIKNLNRLAKLAMVDRATLHRILMGETHRPLAETLGKIAPILGTTVDDLMKDGGG